MANRFSIAGLCSAASILGLAAFAGYRARLVDETYGRYTGCEGCLAPAVWANDALLLAGFLALVATSRLTTSRLARATLACVAAGFVLVYCLDILVFKLLVHRLLASDVLRFAPDASLLTTVVRPLLSRPEGWMLLAGTALTMLAAAAAIALGPATLRLAALLGILSGTMIALATQVTQAEYIHEQALKNLLQVNLEADPGRPYTERAWRQASGVPGLPLHCETGLSQAPSIIVLVVESLSSYHSKLFSGLNDYTPNLDRLAEAGSYFPDFHANGYSTEGGLIALLTGKAPIPTAGTAGSVLAFTEVDGDFHRWLRKRGYRTAFFTPGQLSFGERDRWLPAIGIEYAEGAEHPFYRELPRGMFRSAGDEALFDRFLQWQAAQTRFAPFMATLLTVSTHPPYISALGGPDEADRFREADERIGRFVAQLEARGFFESGVMLIVGDHRAMTPVLPREQTRLGEDAEVSIPGILLGNTGLPRGKLAGNMQQTDLIPSLRHAISGHSCRTELQGRFLGTDPQPARYVVHADPMHRNHVVVIEGETEYTLVLDGDYTHWLEAPPRAQDADRIREHVNRERMRRMVEFRAAP